MMKKLLCAALALAGLAAASVGPADAGGMNGTVLANGIDVTNGLDLANAIDLANGRELNGHDLGALSLEGVILPDGAAE